LIERERGGERERREREREREKSSCPSLTRRRRYIQIPALTLLHTYIGIHTYIYKDR